MECPHIPFGQFPVSSGIVFQTRKFFLSPGCMAPGTYFGSGSFPVSMNISFVSGSIWLIFDAGFLVPQHMRKTFLMIFSIVVEGDIMVMDKDPMINFRNGSFYTFMTLFLRAK